MSIYVSSRDRPDNQDSDRATYRADIRADGINSIGLASYDFITQFDTINSTNATSYISTASQTVPITIPVGMYTYGGLAAAITTQLSGFPGGAIVCTWDGVRFEYTSIVPIRFLADPVLVGTKTWSIMTGVPHGEFLPLATVITGGLADINYTNALYITSNSVCKRQVIQDFGTNERLRNVLGVVYPYAGQTMSESIVVPIHTPADLANIKYINYDFGDPISQIDIEILDERGNPIPEDARGQMQFILELRLR